MILYYFPIAQNTVNKTVSDFFFFRDVNACFCMCTYFTIFLFTGLIPVYTFDLHLAIVGLENQFDVFLRVAVLQGLYYILINHCPAGLIYKPYQFVPGRVAQSVTCLATDASLTADPGVASSIPARSHTFVEIDHEIISTVILLSSAESFKKDCCQLQAKVCARSTG